MTDSTDFGLNYGKTQSYNNMFWLFLILSIIGTSLTSYWIFTKSKTTEDIDNKVKIDDEDENILISGSVLAALGAAAALVIIYLNHTSETPQNESEHSTFTYIVLYLQHVVTFSILLSLTFIYANFASSPTDNIPKVYLEQILIVSIISLIFILYSSWKYFSREFPKNKISEEKNIDKWVMTQHAVSLLVVLSSVIVSGSYLNSGNISSSATTGLAVFSGIGLLLTIGVFVVSYNKSAKQYENFSKLNSMLIN